MEEYIKQDYQEIRTGIQCELCSEVVEPIRIQVIKYKKLTIVVCPKCKREIKEKKNAST